jgi:hypothetical protein
MAIVRKVEKMKKGLGLIVVFSIICSFSLVAHEVTLRATSTNVGSGPPTSISVLPHIQDTANPAFGHAHWSVLPNSSELDSSVPDYDEQLGLTYTNDSEYIIYSVTAIAQNDSNGYGPAYVASGLTDTGYWYQAGLSYNWVVDNGTKFNGFMFVYEVFDPNGKEKFPDGGEGIMRFSNTNVTSGDTINLAVVFSSKNVTMGAYDVNTTASASQSYSNESASTFVGLNSTCNTNGYWSGPCTEWYHLQPYYGNEALVPYSAQYALSSAWMWMDEQNPRTDWEGFSANNTNLLVQYSPNSTQLQVFPAYGATEYSDAYLFETGITQLCALKTTTDGGFYVPKAAFVNATALKVEMLFDNANLTGDQTGGNSPYPAIAHYPDGNVDGRDLTFVASKFGMNESSVGWDYMADVVPDGVIDGKDISTVARNYGNKGSYFYSWSGVEIIFNTGNETPDAYGFVIIPPGATSFNVTQNGTAIGAMIIFCGS